MEVVYKICSKCKLEKPIDCFGPDRHNRDGLNSQCKDCRKLYYRENKETIIKRTTQYSKDHPDITRKAGIKYRDLHLEEKREYSRQYHKDRRDLDKINARKWRAYNPDKIKVYNDRSIKSGSQIKSRYGITWEQYDQILKSQNWLCPICDEPFSDTTKATQPHIDHCHVTNKVRGILHMRCNTMLGHALDNPEILENGARYLRNHGSKEKSNPFSSKEGIIESV